MNPKFMKKVSIVLCVICNILNAVNLSAQENLYKIVSPSGQIIKYVEYDNCYNYSHGLAPVQSGVSWGYIDAEGNPAIPKGKPFYFDAAEEFGKYGLALVWAKGQYRFINTSGNNAFSMEFEEAYGFGEENTAVVKHNGQYGLIDLKGNFAIPAKYEGINRYGNLAVIYNGEKFALFHTNGQALTDFIYDNIGLQEGLMFENRIPVRQNNRWGFTDEGGKLVIPLQYEEVSRFSEGLAGFRENSRSGYLDKEGKLIIPPAYENTDLFSEGLALVSKDNLWGYIGKKGEVVIPLAYSYAGRFNEGVAYVSRGDNNFYIDKTGRQVEEPSLRHTNLETPKLSITAVEEKTNVSLNYPDLQLRVDKFWEANNGSATSGKIYDLRNNQLIGDGVTFERGKIIGGKFYTNGRTLDINRSEGILLADLQKVIAAEAAKPVAKPQPQTVISKEENEEMIKRYTELGDLFDKATLDYDKYYLIALEFDLEASNETERKENLYRKIKPFQETVDKIVEKTSYLLANDTRMKPETRKALTDAIPKYQAMVDKLRSL